MPDTKRSTIGTIESFASARSRFTENSRSKSPPSHGQSSRATETSRSKSPLSQGPSGTSQRHPPVVEEFESARIRQSVAPAREEFPWLSAEFQPIRAPKATQSSPPQWFREGEEFNRNNSQRSQRSVPRESIVDLHLIVSDLDYYAGAVYDYQVAEEELCEVEEEEEEEDVKQQYQDPEKGHAQRANGDGADFARSQIVRKKSSIMMGRNGTMKRVTSSRKSLTEKDVNLVTWDGPDDPMNPKNWTRTKRWMATLAVSLFTFISPVSSSMIAPALQQVQQDLHIATPFLVELSLSIFILGFALGPLFLGPLSELFGRRIILQLGNLFYIIFNLAGGFSTNVAQIIAFRFLSGLGGSAPLGIGGGVLADIWNPTERGRAMALYSLMPLLGPAIGPIAGGFIALYSTWRWVFWSTTIAAGVVQIIGFFFLHETYAAAILSKKKRMLIKITGNKALHTEFDNPSRSFANHIGIAFKRPFILLFTQPIVQVLALYIGYVYGVLYLVLASFARVWSDRYNENTAIAGLNYISLGLGFFIGTQIAAKFADRIYKNLKSRNNDIGRSEFRVPLMFPGALLVPVGLVIYGWSAQYRTHWIVPNIGTAIFAAGNQLVFQNCQTYLVDAYTRYAASAIAATAVFRSLGGFAFPLFAPYMYQALDYGWGNTVLAFIGVGVGLPAPCILWWYGEALRKKSTFAAG